MMYELTLCNLIGSPIHIDTITMGLPVMYFKGLLVCLFVFLLYVPSEQLWSWRDGQFTPHFFLDKLEQAVNQYFVHILSLVTDNNPS